MSDGITDAYKDLWTDDEITEIIKKIHPLVKTPGLDFSSWQPKEYKCTCRSEKTYGINGLHSDWCDKK